MNNRVPNGYKVQHLAYRNGPRHFLFEVMAEINVHLDAQAKTSA